MDLLIIESPNKIKKLRQILGDGYQIQSTVGHFRDLPARTLGVDTRSFEAAYEVDEKKRDMVESLRRAAARAERIILATDPDREGEAIAWHVAQVLDLTDPVRAEFHEITKGAVTKALAKPRTLDVALVEAQQARRILDRLVGYTLSPELKPLGDRLSAGRVQSCVLHLICSRERERLAFQDRRYWTVRVTYANGLVAGLADIDDNGKLRLTQFEAEPKDVVAVLERAEHRVQSVDTSPVDRKPKPPFETSSLLKAAGTRLGWKTDLTSRVAQKLFEGGFITYIRTDSVTVAPEAQEAARRILEKHFPDALPEKPPVYRNKADSQEAHECIRPTEPERGRIPDLTKEEAALYALIWKRFVASQARPARFDRTTVTVAAEDLTLRAVGMRLVEPGFLAIGDVADDEEDGDEDAVPSLTAGDRLDVKTVDSETKKTSPPPRYKEATLIETMKRLGIGRPSTYSSTLDVLRKRGYVAQEEKKKSPALYPTELGLQVDAFLAGGVPDLLEPTYTAAMEASLDRIAEHKLERIAYLREWYADFTGQLAAARKRWAESAPAGEMRCPRCHALMRLREGKFGSFYGCTRYPECRGTRPAPEPAAGNEADLPKETVSSGGTGG